MNPLDIVFRCVKEEKKNTELKKCLNSEHGGN